MTSGSDDRRSAPEPSLQGHGPVVDSLLHPLAVEIRALLSPPQKQHPSRILVDDEENILEAISAGIKLETVFYAGDERLSETLLERIPPGVGVHEVARRTCKKLFENDKVSRVFAIARVDPPPGIDSLATGQRDLIVLEDLRISGNIGSIVRTSLALGVDGLVLLNATGSDIYDRRLIRASRGYIFSLRVAVATLDELVAFCKHRGVQLLATTPRAERPIDTIAALPHRLALAFGGEREGCTEPLLAAADVKVRIPICPPVESLNVSTAAAIALFVRRSSNRVP